MKNKFLIASMTAAFACLSLMADEPEQIQDPVEVQEVSMTTEACDCEEVAKEAPEVEQEVEQETEESAE